MISHFFVANGVLLMAKGLSPTLSLSLSLLCQEQAAATPGLKRHSTALAEAGMTVTRTSMFAGCRIFLSCSKALNAVDGERLEESGD